METPREYYYTYYSYEEWGRGYIGSRRCKCLPEEDIKYFGSFKDKSFRPTQKIILKSHYFTREEAYADEIILQKYYKVVENPHFANRAYQTSTKFNIPIQQSIENGKKYGKIGGKRGGQKTKELGKGVHAFTLEQRIENGKRYGSSGGKIIGKRHKENKTGIFGRTEEQRKKDSSKGGKKVKELGLGIFGLTPEQRSENSRKNGKKYGKKGSKVTNTQKWVCLETGYITNSGALTNYQRARGIDTSKRKKMKQDT